MAAIQDLFWGEKHKIAILCRMSQLLLHSEIMALNKQELKIKAELDKLSRCIEIFPKIDLRTRKSIPNN